MSSADADRSRTPDEGDAGPDGDAAVLAGFDQGPHMAIVVEGPDLIMRAENQLAVEMVGQRSLGVPMREAFGDLAGQQIVEVYERCYHSGEPQEFSEWRVQVDTPDGGVGELFIDFSGRPWVGPGGEVLGVVGAAQDVTEKVLARRAAEAERDAAARGLLEAQLVVRTMQEAHLPAVLPGLDVAARYLLAAQEAFSGGDWFDAVLRPGGQVALVVGDVVGYGTTASATMGQLRAVCHERLTSSTALDAALADVDRFVRGVPTARYATLCVVELDPATGTGRYCTAGHPPPLVVDGAGPRFLSATGAGPLGTSGEFPLLPLELDSQDAVVVLCTDGLLERPGSTPAASTVELAATVRNILAGRGMVRGAPVRMPERICELTLELMTRTAGYSDDITLLAAQRCRPLPPLELDLPARAASLSQARDRLRAWLDDLGVGDPDRLAVTHAVSELLANSVEHAYSGAPEPGRMRLGVALADDGELRVSVADRGRWQEPASAGWGGRGLQLARSLLERLDLVRDEDGTTATGTVRPSRPARLISTPPTPAPPLAESPFEVTEAPGRVAVRGAVLPDAAEELQRRLQRVAAAGAVPTEIDLTEVSHLGSAGIRVLHQLVSAQGTALTLVAPYGSVAQHVLDLVRLPYRTP